MKSISLIWEIPLALFSFLFYKAMKFVIGNLFTVYLALNQDKASQWRVLSAETLNSPLILPVLMTKGPRWNTHAIIGTLGPLVVKKSIEIDLESAHHSAKSWIAVVYSFPNYKTIATIESKEYKFQDKWASLQLKLGKYTLGLRYYNWSDRVELPTVKVDGEHLVNSQLVSSKINNFYYKLIERKNCFYLGLHYYIFTILRLRNWLPESFVRAEYLPVGAPDTQFFYGLVQRGESLEIKVEQPILENYDIYFNIYDRSSLPVIWCQITEENEVKYPIKNNGFYLFRLRPKSSSKKLLNQFSLDCAIQAQGNSIKQLKILVVESSSALNLL